MTDALYEAAVEKVARAMEEAFLGDSEIPYDALAPVALDAIGFREIVEALAEVQAEGGHTSTMIVTPILANLQIKKADDPKTTGQ